MPSFTSSPSAGVDVRPILEHVLVGGEVGAPWSTVQVRDAFFVNRVATPAIPRKAFTAVIARGLCVVLPPARHGVRMAVNVRRITRERFTTGRQVPVRPV